MTRKIRRSAVLLVAMIGLVGVAATPVEVWAQQAVSPSYSVDEAFFGTGGQLCEPGVTGYSANYCATSSTGETVVGNTASPNYQAQGGQNTYREEYIELIVNASSTDLGILSVGSASTTTGTFSVKTYLAGGYVVTNASDPPRGNGTSPHTLANLTSPTASSPGTEQFGINLVANTSPTTFGAAATQIPDNTFSFGAAATGYNTANQFKYVKGDTIANSTKSSGTTNYTVSYLFNISSATPAGQYIFNHDIVATSTY